MSDKDSGKTSVACEPQETGPWDPVLAKLSEWDPAWAHACLKMTTNPWTAGVLPRKFIELVGVALNAACTNLNPDGTRRHIRAALEAGATREEVLFVLKAGALMAIHSCSLGAPILLEEAKAAGAAAGSQAGGEHAGLRRDAGGRTMEHSVGSVLRARPCVDRRVLRRCVPHL